MKAPRLVDIGEKKLMGMHIQTSLGNSKTRDLWGGFMPRRKEISNTINNNLFSIQYYDEDMEFSSFSPQTIFTSWAVVEVNDFDNIPQGMEDCTLEGGLYAVFVHIGATNIFDKTAQYIFEEWLPQSIYKVDTRPHFEIMGEKYLGPDNPQSEEDVWLPIIKK